MGEKYKDMHFRAAEIQERAIDEKNRTVEVIFSSETPVSSWWGYPEILLHTDEAVDLSRLKTVAGVLFNHDPDRIVAAIEEAWIDKETRTGRARIKFDEDAAALEIFGKVRSGSLRGVSVGFLIAENGSENVAEGETKEGFKGPVVLVRKWTPYEFSLTPIPADQNSMIKRAELVKRTLPSFAPDGATEGKEETGEDHGQARTDTDTHGPASMEGREKVMAELRNVRKQAGLAGELEYGIDLFIEGRSVEEIGKALIEKMKEKRLPPVPVAVRGEASGQPGKGGKDTKEIVKKFK